MLLADFAGYARVAPSKGALAYDQAGASYFYRLQPGAVATMIGNGAPLSASDTQLLFRDLDGVCALAF